MKKYDDKGNLIYFKIFNGFESWIEYDNKGAKIHYKDSKGVEQWYDNKGAKITKKQYILSVLIKWRDESNERI